MTATDPLPTRPQRFTGQVALVTGAAHGIGLATAKRLAEDGAAVAMLDRDADRLRAAAQAVRAAGAAVDTHVADVRSPDEVGSAVDGIRERLGPVDMVVANAAVVHAAPPHDETREAFDALLDVNVIGAFVTLRACVADLRARRGSAVIMSSMSAFLGETSLTAYCTSKAALLGMTHQLAAEYARDGVRVNAVCPGWVDTGFGLAGVPAADIAAAVDRQVPLGRQADPAEIAAVVAFLLSADASYVTGHALVVDGGVTSALR